MFIQAIALFMLSSTVAFAADNLQQAANETFANANQNQQAVFSKEDYRQITNNAYKNSSRYAADGQAMAAASNDYLKSENSRKDQDWLIKTKSGLVQKQEFQDLKKSSLELCKNVQNRVQVYCNENGLIP